MKQIGGISSLSSSSSSPGAMSILDLITDISEKHCASLNRIGMRNFENIFEKQAEINVQDMVYKAKINQKEFI